MAHLTPDDSPIVSRDSVQSDDPYEVISSNIEILNALFEEYLEPQEVSRDALRSYYADYYLAQVNNGGFSQFVFNSKWDPQVVTLVREGLDAMGASRHLALFQEGSLLVAAMGSANLRAYLESEYFGENADRDMLNAIDERFFTLEKDEDLVVLNSRWLKQHPRLVVLTAEEIKLEVARRAAAIPDRKERVEKERAAEPHAWKLVRALCEKAGQNLDRFTGADSTYQYKGKEVPAYHFITDHGHHYAIEVDQKAFMFNGTSHEKVAEVDAQR